MHAPLNFIERMELGKELAMVRRNRGIPVGTHESWRVKARASSPAELDATWAGHVARALRGVRSAAADSLEQFRFDVDPELQAGIDPVPFFCDRSRSWKMRHPNDCPF